ncbi:MAG: ParB/RepB/Spo0J family partition protein [Thaumarchaeota archaeon]|nr:ParB/RepB/Spo0J family partition protein [Nitrososphaerota archaeon]
MSRSSLTSERETSKERAPEVVQIDVSKVFAGKINVRRSPGDVGDLADSIRVKGILEPVIVRPVGARYEVVVGSRRLEAAKVAGLKKIPVIVRPMTDEEAIIISLIENIQRRDIEPEEEYDSLVNLRRLNPQSYGTIEQLARAIGKSRKYVEDHMNAVETVRNIRKETKADITVKQSPGLAERREGALPVKHATFLHRAQEAPTVQRLPQRERSEKLRELAETIAPLTQPEAENVVSHFVMSPQRSVERIANEASSLHAVKFEILLDPRVADALRKAAADRKSTMEAIASLALHSWLRQQGYS